MAVSFHGDDPVYLPDGTEMSISFRRGVQGLEVSVDAGPRLQSELARMGYYELAGVTERFGRIRMLGMPIYLWDFCHDIRRIFVPKGKRPFRKYSLRRMSACIPASYQPYGPWKLEPQRDPFDMTTSATLSIPRRYLHDRPLVDMIEELYNTPSRFLRPPVSVSVRLGPEDSDR